MTELNLIPEIKIGGEYLASFQPIEAICPVCHRQLGIDMDFKTLVRVLRKSGGEAAHIDHLIPVSTEGWYDCLILDEDAFNLLKHSCWTLPYTLLEPTEPSLRSDEVWAKESLD